MPRFRFFSSNRPARDPKKNVEPIRRKYLCMMKQSRNLVEGPKQVKKKQDPEGKIGVDLLSKSSTYIKKSSDGGITKTKKRLIQARTSIEEDPSPNVAMPEHSNLEEKYTEARPKPEPKDAAVEMLKQKNNNGMGEITDTQDDTVATAQETNSFSHFSGQGRDLTIVRSSDFLGDADSCDSQEEASVASDDSGRSGLDSLEKFLNIFRCSIPETSETEDAQKHSKGSASTAQKNREGAKEKKNHENESAYESVHSALSSPSRRAYKSWKSRHSFQDSDLDSIAVDSVIEIASVQKEISLGIENEILGKEMISQRDPPDSFRPGQSNQCRDNVIQIDSEETPAFMSNKVPSGSSNNSDMGSNQRIITNTAEPKNGLLVVDTEEETTLPDNLSPIARLRHCNKRREKVPVLYISSERCYV
mmetsp:Transcript_28133/g.49867  ORF Transcript_28133/g.49867 Transcript_28133/m.49867 type:complete len:418 (-) Transcript_28133:216-1469(-)